MRAEVAAVVPASYAETSWGTPSVDLGAGVRAQLRGARRRRPRREPLHPRVRRPLLLPARRRRRRPAGRAGPAARSGMSRRDEIEAGLARVRERIAAACADAGRAPDEVAAGRGHQVLPGLRRPAAGRARRHRRRREPPPGGRGQGRRVRRPRPHLALHRRAAEQQGRRGGGLRRRGRVRRPPQAGRGRSSQGAHQRSHPVDVLLQVSPRPARTARGGRAPSPPSWPTWRPRSTRPGCSSCAG